MTPAPDPDPPAADADASGDSDAHVALNDREGQDHSGRDHPNDAGGENDAPVALDVIERDLAGIESALERLDAGTYWTDEVTGQPIAAEVLERDPIARRAP